MCQQIFVLSLTFSLSINVFFFFNVSAWCVSCVVPRNRSLHFLEATTLVWTGTESDCLRKRENQRLWESLSHFLRVQKFFFFFSKAKGWLDYRCLCLGTTLAVTMGLGEGQGRVGATGIQWIEACNAS